MASENKDEMAATPHKITLKDKSGVTKTWMVSDKILRDMNATKRHAEATGAKPDYSSVLRLGVRMGEVILASRPGTPARFAVEDRFYFGKGRKDRFASKEQALAFIKQYKRNEDSNAHSENVVLLAKFMGNSRAAKLANLVQQINEVAGHMPHGVGQFQYNELHAPLWKQFIAQYGDLYASVK